MQKTTTAGVAVVAVVVELASCNAASKTLLTRVDSRSVGEDSLLGRVGSLFSRADSLLGRVDSLLGRADSLSLPGRFDPFHSLFANAVVVKNNWIYKYTLRKGIINHNLLSVAEKPPEDLLIYHTGNYLMPSFQR
jgi:hypothetical protein